MKYSHHIKKLLVFSQWSGKSYAVFASSGKEIKIARVSIDISDRLIKKNTHVNSRCEIIGLKRNLTGLLEELRQAEGIPNAFVPQLILFINYIVSFTSVQKAGKPAFCVCLMD